MELLIVTQTVDENDPILGFFCRWVEEFAKHIETISVITLKVGTHHFPKNVSVYSLGKEKGGNTLLYAGRFLSLASRLRSEYDTVLVHMNPEYVILAGLFWKILGKKIALWYNHPHFGLRLRVATLFCRKIFYTSPYAAPAHLRKAVRMPAGVDTEVFKPRGVARNRNLIYVQGRITPSKHIDTILEALRMARKSFAATLMLVGPEEPSYGKNLRARFADLLKEGAVSFKGPVPNSETPVLYGASGLSVNLAAAGHYDKSVLESCCCETPVIVSSPAFADIIPKEWTVPQHDAKALAGKITEMTALPEGSYRALGASLRKKAAHWHSLTKLGVELFESLKAL